MNAKIMKKGICLVGFILILLAGLLAVNDFDSDERMAHMSFQLKVPLHLMIVLAREF